MQMELTIQAGEHERIMPGAFDSQIGKEIPVNVFEERTTGLVIAVQVAEDGRSASLTVEVDVDIPELHADVSTMSFGFAPATPEMPRRSAVDQPLDHAVDERMRGLLGRL